jgi:hypothetical protein
VKVHGIINADNLAVLSWELTTSSVADTVVLPALLDQVQHPVSELYADAGYLSSNNARVIRARGATPFIKPRSNTKGRPKPGEKDLPGARTSEAFRDMIDSYQTEREAWMKRYGRRNTVESCWSAIKRRFGHAVGAATSRMRLIESALKLIVWNLTRVTRS